MLAVIDALFWQIIMWTLISSVVVNVFIRIQVYLQSPDHEEFVNDWYEAFEANQAERYKSGEIGWRVKDLSELWSGGVKEETANGQG
jgi:hypothetical protein